MPPEDLKKEIAGTQQFLQIDYIKDDLVILKDGSLHAVVMVSSINMQLRSEQEQESLIATYQNALNALEFPIQILVQSRKVDLSGYLGKLESAAQKQTNELLKGQTEEYIYFLKQILESVNVMDKRFFVVVPFYPNVVMQQSKGILSFFSGKNQPKTALTENEYQLNRNQLRQRTDIVVSLLMEIGLNATPLPTEALIELFYSCFNPETARHEHIKNLSQIGASYISTRDSVNKDLGE